jgi:4-carboxymuconolactone decarboxylase
MTEDRKARGKKIRDSALGKAGLAGWEEMNRICPTHANAIHEYCFGTIWDRPILDLKTRELIVIATAAAQDLPDEVGGHTKGALNRGATPEEVIETILQCSPYIGFPKTNHALRAAQKIIDGWEENQEEWQGIED